jgi:hypothetical protein
MVETWSFFKEDWAEDAETSVCLAAGLGAGLCADLELGRGPGPGR